MPTGARLWGRTTVGVRCAGERPWTVYLQAKVTVQATYYVAARQIAPGEPLRGRPVARDGDLTVLPLAVITDPAQAIGATALARISAGLPLRQDLLKSAASVSAGQTVRVVAAGPVSRFRPRAARWRMRRPASRYGCGWRQARSSRRSSGRRHRGNSAIGTDLTAECKNCLFGAFRRDAKVRADPAVIWVKPNRKPIVKIDSTPNQAGADRQRRDPCAIRHGLVFVRAGGRCGVERRRPEREPVGSVRPVALGIRVRQRRYRHGYGPVDQGRAEQRHADDRREQDRRRRIEYRPRLLQQQRPGN